MLVVEDIQNGGTRHPKVFGHRKRGGRFHIDGGEALPRPPCELRLHRVAQPVVLGRQAQLLVPGLALPEGAMAWRCGSQ
jgi:hypothetical protein